ncbi:MAG: bifunctional phosphopantothenoylcysteine decarboxylase/phosphopantothenate--cysteine ligase CoaBC [Candidatus Krumholzibacteriota bacterium]|nr:bifunctional phosphopantothenoylcysteine decarboxylase/phosphopantothenate--cysteine ligase CoaBC [Candidatus Krumholzibacteriota bacterium]
MKSRRRSNKNEERLGGKNILLVVTGGISAYKSAFLVRLLRRAGAEVKVLMSGAATKFVTPLTFEVLSGNPVPEELFARRDTPSVEHVELAAWADLILAAPATADFIAKLSCGLADDLPSAVLCAARGNTTEILIAPAMNDGMWRNPAVQRNIAALKGDGIFVIDPAEGDLACGTSGRGRMAEPEDILLALDSALAPRLLEGVRAVVTAGRTEEELDPVRYISNRSTGKMGFAIAKRLKRLGAQVTLIHGVVDIDPPAVERTKKVTTAAEMKRSVLRALPGCDLLVMAAAVADYTPMRKAKEKIKKTAGGMSIELKKTDDILKAVRGKKKKGQVVVGFALETGDGEANAIKKIKEKGCDYLVLNMAGNDTGFASDTNQIFLFRGTEKIEATQVISKKEAAALIVERLVEDGRIRKAGG